MAHPKNDFSLTTVDSNVENITSLIPPILLPPDISMGVKLRVFNQSLLFLFQMGLRRYTGVKTAFRE